MCKVLMSINPEYVEKILSGTKNMNLESLNVKERFLKLSFIPLHLLVKL